MIVECMYACMCAGYLSRYSGPVNYNHEVGPVALNEITCTGTETSLFDCPHSDNNRVTDYCSGLYGLLWAVHVYCIGEIE